MSVEYESGDDEKESTEYSEGEESIHPNQLVNCPKCNLLEYFYNIEASGHCLDCSKRENKFLACPTCGIANIYIYGLCLPCEQKQKEQ